MLHMCLHALTVHLHLGARQWDMLGRERCACCAWRGSPLRDGVIVSGTSWLLAHTAALLIAPRAHCHPQEVPMVVVSHDREFLDQVRGWFCGPAGACPGQGQNLKGSMGRGYWLAFGELKPLCSNHLLFFLVFENVCSTCVV